MSSEPVRTDSGKSDAEENLSSRPAGPNLLRQRERTVDNIKWLFAYVFAISFTMAAKNVFDAAEPMLRGATMPALGFWPYLGALLVFTVTASVFYHQGAKFFDWRYASGINDEANRLGFVIDFATLVVTMIPFMLMANSLVKTVTSAVGLTAFVYGYIWLVGGGLIWLLLFEVRHSQWFRNRLNENLAKLELQRDKSVRTYWFGLNGTIFIILSLGFVIARHYGDACPAKPGAGFPFFLLFFAIIAVVRDALDFFWVWPVLYPVAPSDRRFIWPMTYLMSEGMTTARWPRALGISIAVVAVVIGFRQGLFNYADLVRACI